MAEGKTFDADKCECIENASSCEKSEDSCNAEGKLFDKDECECIKNPCQANEHYYNKSCESDTLENCGAHEYECAKNVKGWKAGSCTEAKCVATECEDGYQLKDDKCRIDANKGDIITFGRYEQDNDLNTTDEPISWQILDISETGTLLVISEKALDAKQYHSSNSGANWEKSSIRSWLNGYGSNSGKGNSFIDTAFNEAEKAMIATTTVTADAVEKKPLLDQGADTQDKIFLLSAVEVKKYFNIRRESESKQLDARVDATPYVVAKYVYVSGSDTGSFTDDGTCAETHCYISWWLRSMASNTSNRNSATSVGGDGYLSDAGSLVTRDDNAVRPAMWLDI